MNQKKFNNSRLTDKEKITFFDELKKYKKNQSIVISKLINAGFTKGDIYSALSNIYPEKKSSWPKSRLRLFESAYGFMGFFDTNTSDERKNVVRNSINENELTAYLESNKISQDELISLYEKVQVKYEFEINAVKEKNKKIISFLKKELRNRLTTINR